MSQPPPVPVPLLNVPEIFALEPEPVNASPSNVVVKISPPVSTDATLIVKSFAGVAPPIKSPVITIASPIA